MPRCRSCEAPIEWAAWEKSGKPCILDASADPNGKLVCVAGKVRYATAEDDRLRRPRRTSHFATCPNADQHRRG